MPSSDKGSVITRPLSPGGEMQVAFDQLHRLGMPVESSDWAWYFC